MSASSGVNALFRMNGAPIILSLAAALFAPALAQEAPADLGPIQLSPISLAPDLSGPAADHHRNAELKRALDAAFATGDFVGLAVAVVRGGETRFIGTWGVADAGAGAPVTENTVFRVGSLSKGFASSLAGLAMIEGKLRPDEKATLYAPGLKLAGGAEKSLELGHILSHQTGLPPNAYDNLLEAGTPVAEILPKYAGVKPICGVGKCYSYQNIAFDIIASAISSAYGESYAEAAEHRLFAPLGMKTASVGAEGLVRTGDFARPHERKRLSKTEETYGPWRAGDAGPYYYRIPAAGGVNASILDMAIWLKAQMGRAPSVLPPAALELIHAPRIISPAETARMRTVSPRFHAAQYAFGWRLYNYAGAPVIAHSGTVDGYAAQIAWLPEKDVGIVILSNARPRRIWRILPTFLDLELGLEREDWLALADAAAKAP